MIDDTIFNWEKILTILIGIVIVASIYIIIARRIKAKRKRLEREGELFEKQKTEE